MPICASTLVLTQLAAELARPLAGGLERAREALGDFLFVEHLERRLGGARLGGHVLPQGGGRLAARRRELGSAQNRVQRKLERGVLFQTQLFRRRRQLLD